MYINSITQLFRVDKTVVQKLSQLVLTNPMEKIGTRTTVHKEQGLPNEVVTADIFLEEFYNSLAIDTNGDGYFRADYKHIPKLPLSDTFVFDYDGAGWDFHQTTTVTDFTVSYKNNDLVAFPMELDEAKNKADYEAGIAKAKIVQNISATGLNWENHVLAIANISADFKQNGVYTSRVPLSAWDNNRSLVQVKVPVVVDRHINNRNYDQVLEVLRGGTVVKNYSSGDLRQVRTVETDGTVSWNVLLPISTNPTANAYTFRFNFYGKGNTYPPGSSLPNIQNGSIALNLGVAVLLPDQRPSIVLPIHPTDAIYTALRDEFANKATIPLYGDVVLVGQADNPAPTPGIDMEHVFDWRVNFRTQSSINFMSVYAIKMEDYLKTVTNPGEDLAALRITDEDGGPNVTLAELKRLTVRDSNYVYFAQLKSVNKPSLGERIELPTRTADGFFPQPADNSVLFVDYKSTIEHSIVDSVQHTATLEIRAEDAEFPADIAAQLAKWIPNFVQDAWVEESEYRVTINSNNLFGEWRVRREMYGDHAFAYVLIPEIYRTIIGRVSVDNPSAVLEIQVRLDQTAEVPYWTAKYTAKQLRDVFGADFNDTTKKLKVYFPLPMGEVYGDVYIKTVFDPDADGLQILPVTVNTLITTIDDSSALINPNFRVYKPGEPDWPKVSALVPNLIDYNKYVAEYDQLDPNTVLVTTVTPDIRQLYYPALISYSSQFHDWLTTKAETNPNHIAVQISVDGGEEPVNFTVAMLLSASVSIGDGAFAICTGIYIDSDADVSSTTLVTSDIDLVNATTELEFRRVIEKADATLLVSEAEEKINSLWDNLEAETNPVLATLVHRDELPVESVKIEDNHYGIAIQDVPSEFIGKKVILPFGVDLTQADPGSNEDIADWSLNNGALVSSTHTDLTVRKAEGWRYDQALVNVPVLFDLVDFEGVKRDKYTFKYNPSKGNDRWFNPTEVTVEVHYSLKLAQLSEVKVDYWVSRDLFDKIVQEPEIGLYLQPETEIASIELNGTPWLELRGGNPSWFGKLLPIAYRIDKSLIDQSTAADTTEVVTVKCEYLDRSLRNVVDTVIEKFTLAQVKGWQVEENDYSALTIALKHPVQDPDNFGHFACKVTVQGDFDGEGGDFLPTVAVTNLINAPWLETMTLNSEPHVPSRELYTNMMTASGLPPQDFMLSDRNIYTINPKDENELWFLKDPEATYDLPGFAAVKVYGDLWIAFEDGWENTVLGLIDGQVINRAFIEKNFTVKTGAVGFERITEMYVPFIAPISMINGDVVPRTEFKPDHVIFSDSFDAAYTMGTYMQSESEFEFNLQPTQELFDRLVDEATSAGYITPSMLTYRTGTIQELEGTIVTYPGFDNGKKVLSLIEIPKYHLEYLESLVPNAVIGVMRGSRWDQDGVEQSFRYDVLAGSVVSHEDETDFCYILIDTAAAHKGVVQWNLTMDFDQDGDIFWSRNRQAILQTVTKSEISCEGAENITNWMDLSGDWQLEIGDEVVLDQDTPIEQVIAAIRQNGLEVIVEEGPRPEISCDGATTITGTINDTSGGGTVTVYLEGVNKGEYQVGSPEFIALMEANGIRYARQDA